MVSTDFSKQINCICWNHGLLQYYMFLYLFIRLENNVNYHLFFVDIKLVMLIIFFIIDKNGRMVLDVILGPQWGIFHSKKSYKLSHDEFDIKGK